MLDFIERIAEATGLPMGIKSAVGDMRFWELAILDGLSVRSARDVFRYEEGWGLPSEAERAAIREIMTAKIGVRHSSAA